MSNVGKKWKYHLVGGEPMPKKKWGKVGKDRKGNLFMCCMRGFVCQGAVQGVIFNIFSYYTSPFEGKFEIMYKAYTPRHLIHFCVVNV